MKFISYILDQFVQGAGGWRPGMPFQSDVDPPDHERDTVRPHFTREETEVFTSYTRSRVGEVHGDRVLQWGSNPKFDPKNVRYRSIKTLSAHATNHYVPDHVQRAEFTEKLDGNQRLIFFYRHLYDAIKQLLRNARFAGHQYTQANVKFNQNGKRVFEGFDTGELYEIAQIHAGEGVSPVPVMVSSDGLLVSKKMGGHPVLCKSPISIQLFACTLTLWYVLVRINTYWYVYLYI
jgi:hypothetical protein